MYMLLRREDYLNVMVHVCDSFLKDKRLTLPHVGSTHQTLREACCLGLLEAILSHLGAILETRAFKIAPASWDRWGASPR